MAEKLDIQTQKVLVILFFFGFAVKIPILPFYSWLPEAHVEAPALGSVLLASIMLKVGAYGLIRFMLPLFKEAIMYYYYFFAIFCVLSIIVSSILAIGQIDMKKIIAYSSIAHMNYIVIALLGMEVNSIAGSILYLVSHAFTSAGLFFIIGYLYEKYGTRNILSLNSLYNTDPSLAFFILIFNLANLAFPLSSSFIAEIVLLTNLASLNMMLIFLIVLPLFFTLIFTF
jgi:NADH-quinone oxidoreductase subunit M